MQALDPRYRKPVRIAAVAIGMLVMVAIGSLTWNVATEIKAQRTASSDVQYWSLARAEVEFQDFNSALRLENNLPAIRRRFDVFYSRISTIEEASAFAELRRDAVFKNALSDVRGYLNEIAKVVDGSPENFQASLSEMRMQALEIKPVVRQMANTGAELFAKRAEFRRESLTRWMMQLAQALGSLIAALALGVVFLIRLNNRSTLRARTEAQTLARANAIMDTSLDAVILSDDSGRIMGFNNAAEKLFGHEASKVIGREMGEVIVPDHLREAHDAGIERMRRNGKRHVVGKGRVVLEAKRSNGSVFPVELAIQSAMTAEGEIFVAFLRDISRSVANEVELIKARDKAIAGEKTRSEFLATMSHEIRTPLNGLIGTMSLLRDTDLAPQQEVLLQKMETSGRLLMSHVSDVLDIARYDAGKISVRSEPMNVSALLQDIVDTQSGRAQANGTTLNWKWKGPAHNWIAGDPDRLQHILMNLVGNAVKFTKKGRVTITASWSQGNLSFVVEDTGSGIANDLKPHVFDDFVTGNSAYDRDVGGTGLGLSIVKRFVLALNGKVDLQSEQGVGSRFEVTVPAAKSEPAFAEQQDEVIGPADHSLSVLVVEDNEINRFVVGNMLEADGHIVTEAFDGQQGVEAAFGTAFDLILMDISMPVLDGREATSRIRQGKGASSVTTIFALTANAMPGERKALLESGIDGVLTKPITKAALRRVLASVPPLEAAGAEALIDVSHNSETRDVVGPEVYASLLRRFFEELDDFVEWLDLSKDAGEIAARAHKVSGSAALFGASVLCEVLGTLQSLAKTGGLDEAKPHVLSLPKLGEDTKNALISLASKAPSQ